MEAERRPPCERFHVFLITMVLRGGQARIVDTEWSGNPAKKASGSFTDNSSEETTLEKVVCCRKSESSSGVL